MAAAEAEEEQQLARALEESRLAAVAGAKAEEQLDEELLNAGIEASLNQEPLQRLYDHTRPAVPGCGWVAPVRVRPRRFGRADVEHAKKTGLLTPISLVVRSFPRSNQLNMTGQ